MLSVYPSSSLILMELDMNDRHPNAIYFCFFAFISNSMAGRCLNLLDGGSLVLYSLGFRNNIW
jgi:hypothetical protein